MVHSKWYMDIRSLHLAGMWYIVVYGIWYMVYQYKDPKTMVSGIPLGRPRLGDLKPLLGLFGAHLAGGVSFRGGSYQPHDLGLARTSLGMWFSGLSSQAFLFKAQGTYNQVSNCTSEKDIGSLSRVVLLITGAEHSY